MADALMSRRDAWEDPHTLINFLANQIRQGKLAVVLGAGVSMPFGLPSWVKLLERLFASKGAVVPTVSLPRAADKFRIQYYKNDYPGYLAAVKAALYEGVEIDTWGLRANRTLSAVASMAVAGSKGGVANVISFNFDDLLEYYLEQHGISATKISTIVHWAVNASIRVFHPHGVLPLGSRPGASERIVFDQTSFSRWLSAESQAWREELHAILRSHTCLFIGLSGDDQDLDVLLNETSSNHIAVVGGMPFWGVAFVDDATAGPIWEERGIWAWQTDFTNELPQILFQACSVVSTGSSTRA